MSQRFNCPQLWFKALLVVMTCCALLSSAYAETLTLISGKTVSGQIVHQDDETVKMDTGVGIAVTYFMDEIQLIDGIAPKAAPVEMAQPSHQDETAQELEPINVIEDIADDQAQADKPKQPIKPELKIEKNNDLSVVEDQAQSKESPSPFGPTLKEGNKTPGKQEIKSEVTVQTENNQKSASFHLIDRAYKEGGVAPTPSIEGQVDGANTNVIIRNYNQFIAHQKENIKQLINKTSDLALITKERLYMVPVSVRQDMLVFTSCALIALYVLVCFPMMNIARRLGRKHRWLVWIPVVQVVYFLYMADKSLLWILLFAVPGINLLALIYVFGALLRELHESAFMALFIVVPGINIMMLWFVAFKKPPVA